MGKYIDYIDGKHIGTSFQEKVNALIKAGAVKIAPPTEFKPDTLICVVDNAFFAAAAYTYDEQEMKDFWPTEHDQRPRQWLELKNASRYINY